MRVLLGGILLCASCAVGPDYQRPDFTLPESYRNAYATKIDAGPWWTGFEDRELDLLVLEALDGNLTVAAAEARLRRAEAFITAERSDLLPVIDGAVEGRSSDPGTQGAEPGLFAGFTPDLFGDRRRELQAAKAEAVSAEAALFDARRITAASLASAYLDLRRTDARIALLDQSLDLQQQTLRIVRLRAEAGLAADLDVQRAAADLARTRAQRGPLAASRADANYVISVLTGDYPGENVIAPEETPRVPSFVAGPEVGVPANLLRARPDLRAAEADLIAATAEIGAQVADLYPSLDLSGVVSTDIDGGDLAGDAVSTIAGVLDVPLLDFGRRRAEVRAARASADEALALYERTLLDALRETESALVAIDAAEARRADLEEAVTASEIAFDQLQALYKEGLATLIDVLDAQRQLIASRESYVESEAALAQAYVSLYAALGAPTGTDEG